MGVLSPRTESCIFASQIQVSDLDLVVIEKLFQNRLDTAIVAKWILQYKDSGYKQKRLLLLSQYRIITMKRSKIRGLVVSKNFPLLDMKKFKVVQTEDGLLLEFNFGHRRLMVNADVNSETYARNVQKALSAVQHNFPDHLMAEVEIPQDLHWQEFGETMEDITGFTNTYKAFCDYYKANYRKAVIAAIQETQLEGESKNIDFEYCFQNCRDPEANHQDAMALVGALRTSLMFDSVTVQGFDIGRVATKFLFEALEHNFTIRGVLLSEVTLTIETLQAFQRVAIAQSAIRIPSFQHNYTRSLSPKEEEEECYNFGLKELDLENSKLNTESVHHLAAALKAFKHGLQVLGLKNCRLNYNMLLPIIVSIRSPAWLSSLKEINLSDNHIGLEGSHALAELIISSTALLGLKLANTDVDTSIITEALQSNERLHRCSLIHLDISYNKMTNAAGRCIGEILGNTSSLVDIKLQACKLRKQHISDILGSVFQNSGENTPFSIDLSHNNLSGSKGKLLAALILDSPMSYRERIVLNYCSMGYDTLHRILLAFCSCASLNSLSLEGTIGKSTVTNIFTIDKLKTKTAESIRKLLTPSGDQVVSQDGANVLALGPPPIKELCLNSTRFPIASMIVESAVLTLMRNDVLEVLDITGNKCGDVIAEALHAVLPKNTTLKALFWDGNNTSVEGFKLFSDGLQLNKSLAIVPVPVHDTQRILTYKSTFREELFCIFGTIYKAIERNQANSHHVLSPEDGDNNADEIRTTTTSKQPAAWEKIMTIRAGRTGTRKFAREMKAWQNVSSIRPRKIPLAQPEAMYCTLPTKLDCKVNNDFGNNSRHNLGEVVE